MMNDKADVIPSDTFGDDVDIIQQNEDSTGGGDVTLKHENTATTTTTTTSDDASSSCQIIKSHPDSKSYISEEEEVQVSSSEPLSKGEDDSCQATQEDKRSNNTKGSPSASFGCSVPPLVVPIISASIEENPQIIIANGGDIENGGSSNNNNLSHNIPQKSITTTTSSRRWWYNNLRWWLPCLDWSRERSLVAFVGCLSSSVVLAIRLFLDNSPSTYLIHSIIIFIDMILIHLFTFSTWLSVSGEALTVVSFLSYHYTTEAMFEFIETTMIAVLCSFHMIVSRNKHWEHEEQLEDELSSFRDSVRSLHDGSHDRLIQSLPSTPRHNINNALINRQTSRNSSLSRALYSNAGNDAEDGDSLILPHHHNEHHHNQHHRRKNKTRMHLCCGHFFEHFLDGSAGVMYTSFLGLIIDEAINYGKSKCV